MGIVLEGIIALDTTLMIQVLRNDDLMGYRWAGVQLILEENMGKDQGV